MRTDRDIQRLLDQWLADGPNRASDRVFDEVVDRVNRQRQRPAWRLTWSLPTMNAILRPASVVGAVVVLALGGLFVLRPGQNVGAPAAVPTPSPTPTPTAPPTPSPSPIVLVRPTSALAPGTYAVVVSSGRVTFTVPSGWSVPQVGPDSSDFRLHLDAGPADDVMNVFFNMRRAAKDAACTEAPEPGVGSTAQALVADLTKDRNLHVSSSAPITVGGNSGYVVDLSIAPTATRTCPFSSGAPSVPLVVDTIAGTGPFWGVGPAEKIRLVILDAPRVTNVVVVVDSSKGASFDQLVGASMPVVQSLTLSQG